MTIAGETKPETERGSLREQRERKKRNERRELWLREREHERRLRFERGEVANEQKEMRLREFF